MNSATDIPDPIVREHVTRLCDTMRERDFAATILFHTSNMLAFAGTRHASSDRLTCGAVTRDGRVHVVCPAFERPALTCVEKYGALHTWQEHEDAYRLLAAALRADGLKTGKIGVDGRMWLSALGRFQAAFDGQQVQSADDLIREVRIVKSPAEQQAMRAAHARGEQVHLKLRELLGPGAREIDLGHQLAEHFEPHGLRVAPLIQSGPNGAIPHNPTGARVLAEGDTVVVDSVIQWQAYKNDLTRTFAVGRPSARARAAYHVVRRAQAAAFEAARPGVPCRQLDEIARAVIDQAGFGEYFTHRLGHGIGLEGHEPPYLDGGNDELLRPGMCCTVEPGVYVPGEFGVRIEDVMMITDDGCEVIRGELPTDVTTAFDG